MNEDMATGLPWVLIEGPGPGDADFLGRWLGVSPIARQLPLTPMGILAIGIEHPLTGYASSSQTRRGTTDVKPI
jgi:hypothetical protein